MDLLARSSVRRGGRSDLHPISPCEVASDREAEKISKLADVKLRPSIKS